MRDGTIQDLVGSAVAAAVFLSVLYVPGHLLARWLDLFGFRRQGFAERAAWSLVLSFGSVPLGVYLLGRWAGLNAVCWVVLGLLGWFVVVQARGGLAGRRVEGRRRAVWLGAACVWTGFVLMSLVDVQVGHRLYFSVIEFDQSYRVAFTNAVLRTGVPPANPLYFSGHLQSMRYYYFWYAVCAVVARVAHVSAQQAFVASSVWTGFALVALLYLYVRHFCGEIAEGRRLTLIAVALLAVTGADLVPAVGSWFAQTALNGEMEWWSIDQFYSWQDSILWVPHHLAALICCLLAFLLLWRTREGVGRRDRGAAVVLAGVAMASSLGLSVYVLFGFVLLMGMWTVFVAVRQREQAGVVWRLALAGVVAGVLSGPFLQELLLARSTGEGGRDAHATGMFQVSVRRMIDPELVTGMPVLAGVARAHPVLLDTTMRLLLLLPGLGLELGVYGVVLVLLLRARFRRGRGETAGEDRAALAGDSSLYLTVAGLVMVSFVRSSVIRNNDFAYRASMFPQFFLLLQTAELLLSWWVAGRPRRVPMTPGRRRTVYALLALGLAGTVYQAGMLRMFLPLEAGIRGNGFEGLPKRVFEARRALEQMNRTTPETAVLGFNAVPAGPPARGDVVPPFTFFSRAVLMYANRQMLSAEPTCATQFGGDSGPCAGIERGLARLYARPGVSAAEARAFCGRFGVGYLLVSDYDAVWGEKAGWVAELPVLATESALRIVRCSE